jgi:hypothetical protein
MTALPNLPDGVTDPDDWDMADEQGREAWKINDNSSADWAMRKYVAATRRVAAVNARADYQRDRIDRWQSDANAADVRSLEHFTRLLGDYALAQREGFNVATVKTTHGNVSTSKRGGISSFVNKPAFIEYASKHGGLDTLFREVKPDVDKKRVDEWLASAGVFTNVDGVYLDGDGVVIPGIQKLPVAYGITVKPDMGVA